MASGADKMVYNLRSLAVARPHHVFVATDIKNAFGAVLRHKALQALLSFSPQLAPIMALFWKPKHTSLLLPRTPDSLSELEVTQGVFQGECLSTAVFCIFLRSVIDKFYTDVAQLPLPLNFTQPPRELVTVLAYVDDVVISCDPALFDYIWPLWISTLANHGLQVEPSKCKAWIPVDTHKGTST